MDFKSLLKKNTGTVDSLTKKLDAMSTSYANPDDDKYWQPTVGPDGNGHATIRFIFLENKETGVTTPFERLWSHAFKGPSGKWYIENCLSTIGKDDPVNELNNTLWNSGNEEDKETVRRQKRKLHYIANIYVVDDPANPDNNGKVFLFKFGQKIFDKIKSMAEPEFDDETPVNVFDFVEGANFKLRIRKVAGFRNYDKSTFDAQSPLAGGDEGEMERIWKAQHSVSEVVDEKNFKSYDELKTKMNAVLGLSPSGAGKTAMDRAEEESGASDDDLDLSNMGSSNTSSAASSIADDDDDLDIFRKLAEED